MGEEKNNNKKKKPHTPILPPKEKRKPNDTEFKTSAASVSFHLPGSIFCMLTLLCWNRSVSHSRSFSFTSCCRQSRKSGKCVPFSSWWAKSAMLTRSAMIARAANWARYDFTSGISSSILGHWSRTPRKACLKMCGRHKVNMVYLITMSI